MSIKAKTIKPSSTLAITAKAKQLKAEGIDVIGFGAGEPDFDTPDFIKEAAIQAISDGFTKYTPASGLLSLKEAVCNKLYHDHGLKYEPNQVVISNGAKHALTNVFMAILNPEDEVIIPAPYWLSYPQIVKLADGVPVTVPTTKELNYKVTVEQLEAVVTPKTKALILNCPSNPTGMIYSKEELEALADFAIRHNLYVVSDEIYEKLIYDHTEHVSIASLNDAIFKRTIIVNGVSKSYSMTGWRIGYVVADAEIAQLMANMQSHATSNPNAMAQKAAEAALTGPQTCVQMMKEEFEKRRNYMYDRVKALPFLSAIKPQGAFYLFVDITKIIGKTYLTRTINQADDLADLLLEYEKVAVIPCGDFGCEDHIRLSYAISMEQIEEGLNRMEAFIEKLEG